MFAMNQIGRHVQHYICMALSAVIVASTLGLGGYAAQSVVHDESYSVTITQIQ
jgi:ABC-type proline/glycine betaine transport system permease subunit